MDKKNTKYSTETQCNIGSVVVGGLNGKIRKRSYVERLKNET